MIKEQYVLEAETTIQNPFSDGYYTGKSFIYQRCKYAVVDNDIAKAKVYTSQARAFRAMGMEFNNYSFKAVKLHDINS